MGRVADLILDDAYRITGRRARRDVVTLLLRGDTFRYTATYRVASTASTPLLRLAAKVLLRHYRYSMGINLPAGTTVGRGLFLGHAGGIVINSAATIGDNCNISHGVTIGVARGKRAGVPRLGNRVYVGPGAVLVGDITIGDGAAIGANAVVTRDVPSEHTAVGIPARCRPGGSGDYVNRTV